MSTFDLKKSFKNFLKETYNWLKYFLFFVEYQLHLFNNPSNILSTKIAESYESSNAEYKWSAIFIKRCCSFFHDLSMVCSRLFTFVQSKFCCIYLSRKVINKLKHFSSTAREHFSLKWNMIVHDWSTFVQSKFVGYNFILKIEETKVLVARTWKSREQSWKIFTRTLMFNFNYFNFLIWS